MRRVVAAGAAAASALAVADQAVAHVTLHPNSVPQGGFVALNVRVPNEEANAATTKVDVKLPPGLALAAVALFRRRA
jgi:uncharacterized protein YcnI